MGKQIIIGLLVVAAVFIGLNLLVAVKQAAAIPAFWEKERGKVAGKNDVRLLALGDSATQAIGASDPMKGFVGRSAQYIQQKTGRSVHIDNVSRGGASLKSIVSDQIPRVNLAETDIILVSGSSDFERRIDLKTFTDDMNNLLNALPAHKTIISDLPVMPGRDKYQNVLAHAADKRKILRADFAGIFSGEGRRLDIFSWLPLHLNDKGYEYWFKAFQPQLDALIERNKLSKEGVLS